MSMDQAVASNWVLEKFSATGDGFNLIGTTKGYASFSRAFADGTTVFYAASDDDGNREAGYGVYSGNRLTDCVATATLVGGQYNDSKPSRLTFSKGGTIAGTFNAIAFNELWKRDAGAGMVISVQPPSDPITGMQWLDSSTAEVWIWDDDKWLQFPVGGSGGGVGANVQIEEFPPEYPNVGDLWTDYGTTGELYIWDGRYWVSMTGDGGPKVILGGEEGGAIELPENITLDNLEDAGDADKALARHISLSGVGKWLPIKTGDIETDPSVTFRDAKGRFKSTKQYEDLTDQLKVNRFLAGEIESQGESIANNSEGVEEAKAGIRRIDNQVAENTSNIIQLQDAVEGIEIPDVPSLPEDLATMDDVADAVASEANTRRIADEGLQKEIEDLAETVANIDIPDDVDLSGYATKAFVDEVDRTSQMRDEALKAQAEEWDVLNTAVHLRLEDQILRSYAWSQGDNEKLENKLTKVDEDLQAQIDELAAGDVDLSPVEDRLDDIEAVLPKTPEVIDPVEIGGQTLKITGSRPTGAGGEAGKVLMWKAEAGSGGSPYNECKFIVPDTSVIDPNAASVWWKQGDKVQRWDMGGNGWLTNGNVLHYSASETFGDTLVDGAPIELFYIDPNTTGDDFVDVISRIESKADDRRLQVEIDQIALALETLLVQREHGQWKYVGFTGDNIPRNAGEFSLAVADIASSNENIITINQEDLKGITHGFGDVEVGDYVEVVNTEEPTSYALFVVTKAPEGTGIVNVEVGLKDTGYNIWNGETCEIRFFAVNEQDIALEDLDSRYVSKTAGDQTMTGPLTISGLGTWKGSRIKLDYVTANSDTSKVALGTPSNEQNLRVYDDKVQVTDVPFWVKTIAGFANGYGTSYTGAYEEPDHIATKKDVEAALAGGGADLSGLVQKSGDTMTGILELPRFNVKKHDGEAICLIEGKVDGTATSARLTFSNKINANAYGNLTWNGNSGQGWFQFNKDVDFSTKGLHSVNNIRLIGNKAIQEAQTTRIKFENKVVITKTGTGKDGFVLKGATSEGADTDLFSVYHNSDGLDSINYKGKTGGSTNIATCGYVDSKVGGSKGALVSHMERLYHKGNQTDGKSFYFQNQYSAPTTAMNDFRKFRWKLPSSHYLQDMAGAGRDMGYIVVCNTGGSLLYQCQVSNAQKDGLYITLDLDHDNHYGTSILGDAGWYVVHLFSCLRER